MLSLYLMKLVMNTHYRLIPKKWFQVVYPEPHVGCFVCFGVCVCVYSLHCGFWEWNSGDQACVLSASSLSDLTNPTVGLVKLSNCSFAACTLWLTSPHFSLHHPLVTTLLPSVSEFSFFPFYIWYTRHLSFCTWTIFLAYTLPVYPDCCKWQDPFFLKTQ